jgi:hypothetical protein
MPLRIGGGLSVDEAAGRFDFPLESGMGAVAFVRIDQSANDDIALPIVIGTNGFLVGQSKLGEIVGNGLRDVDRPSQRILDRIGAFEEMSSASGRKAAQSQPFSPHLVRSVSKPCSPSSGNQIHERHPTTFYNRQLLSILRNARTGVKPGAPAGGMPYERLNL